MSQSKFLKVFTIIALFALVFSFNVVPTSAQLNSYKVVANRKGLNKRDAKCNKIGSVGFGNILNLESGTSINCKINNQNIKFIKVSETYSNDGASFYVAEVALKNIISSNADISNKTTLIANNKTGVNLRDRNCKRLVTVPNGTLLNVPQGQGGSIKICRVGGNFYDMIEIVEYKGKSYMVATALVK